MLNSLEWCGDIHSLYERTSLFIEGVLPAIQPLVLQARQNHPDPPSRARWPKLALMGSLLRADGWR